MLSPSQWCCSFESQRTAALVCRVPVTSLVAGLKRVTSLEPVLKTIPWVSAEACSSVVSPPPEPSEPQLANRIPSRVPPVKRSILRRDIVRPNSGAAALRSFARSDEPPDVAYGPQVGSSAHLGRFFGAEPLSPRRIFMLDSSSNLPKAYTICHIPQLPYPVSISSGYSCISSISPGCSSMNFWLAFDFGVLGLLQRLLG